MTVRRRRLLEERQREVVQQRERRRVISARRVRSDAFELYYGMGTGRSYQRVAEQLGKNPGVIGRWAGEDEWTKRVKERDEEIDRRLNELVISREVNARARYGTVFDGIMVNILNYINKLDSKGRKIELITSIKDLESVARIGLLLHGDRLEPENDNNGGVMMEQTTVKKLVADPEARASLETLWRRLPVVQGQIEVGEAGG